MSDHQFDDVHRRVLDSVYDEALRMIFCQQCGGRTAFQQRDGRERLVCERCGAVTFLDPKLAAAVIIERNGQLLFGLRGPSASGSGKWSLPAGFVERGEQVEDAAIREAREEVGLDVALGPLLGLFSENGETVVLAVYLTTSYKNEPVAGDDHIDLAWFKPDDLPELAFARDAAIVRLWREVTGAR
jgi:8-oxo-dGTP diphosphatase